MKKLLELAVEKGFKPKTLTTRWTLEAKLGIKKSETFLVNETCEYLLLCEIQKWLREKHGIYLVVQNYSKASDEVLGFRAHIFPYLLTKAFDTYEEALEKGLQEALKLIDDKSE